MSTPIGQGPSVQHLLGGQGATDSQNNPFQFRLGGDGSATAQLLQGKIARARTATVAGATDANAIQFRDVPAPSARTQMIMDQLAPL